MWLFIRRRNHHSGQGCDHSHPRRGYLRNRWIFWSRKSTLVRVINLLQKTICRKITIDDDVIFDGRWPWRQSSYVVNVKTLGWFSSISTWWVKRQQRKMWPLPLNTLDSARKKKKAKVAKLLDLVGLADRAENYPSQLSGGQKTACGHCACLGKWSENFDFRWVNVCPWPKTTKQILALLQDLNQKLGLTVVWLRMKCRLSKTLPTVWQLCRMVVWLKRVVFLKSSQI